jgi:hypothetical protein
MPDSAQFLFNTFDINLGSVYIPIPYWQAAALVVLIFLLILVMAQYRRHTVDWSMKGAVLGVFLGFLLALFLEGFLIIGGRTALTGVLGWKNPPLPIARVLEAGRSELIQVLGIQTEIPASYAMETGTVQDALEVIQSLNPQDLKSVKGILCAP